MNQFDVINVQGDLGVVVESHLLAPDKTVIPPAFKGMRE